MFCILASKWSVVGGRLRLTFYRPQETFRSLNRDSSLLRIEVIGKISFFHFFGVIKGSNPALKKPSNTGLDLSFAGSQGEYHCMWRCPRSGLNPSGLVNNSSLAAGPQFTEMKIL